MMEVLTQMIVDRGFEVMERKPTYWIATAAPQKTLFVSFLEEAKIGIESIRSLEKILPRHDTVIVVYSGTITSAAKTVASLYPKLQFFHRRELLHNITKHAFVPTHTLLSDSEAQEFLTRNKFTKDQLPKLPISDPLAKYFHFKPGSLVRIRRRFGVQIGEYDYVRVVVQHV